MDTVCAGVDSACIVDYVKSLGHKIAKPCQNCPITDPDDLHCMGGLYDKWLNATTDEERQKYAKLIKEIPWEDEKKTKTEMENEKVEEKKEAVDIIKINGRTIALTDDLAETIMKILEGESDKRWRSAKGEYYYYVDYTSLALGYREEYGQPYNDNDYANHNYFKLEDEAKEYVDVLTTERQLREYADSCPAPDLSESVYTIVCDKDTNKPIIVRLTHNRVPRVIYFDSEKSAKKAIEYIGEDKLVSYLTYNW